MSVLGPKTVLAVDPGSAKCGLAVVRRDAAGQLTVLWRRIAPVDQLEAALAEGRAIAPLALVVVGDGTRSQAVVQRVREAVPSIGLLVVDERNTSMHARERYWEHHPRRGWRRFLPATMQVPPVPVDDFVAVILAERVLAV